MAETTVFTDTGNRKSNQVEYSVSEISSSLKRAVEEQFGNVRIRGEITGFRGPHSSGHCYFALKDDRARIEAVIWRGVASRLKHMPEEGLEVIASGKLTTYAGSSKYQIVIDGLEPAGAGALMALLEERKKKLQAEGLFDADRKKPIPYMPRKIGVITSPTGAVIRDVLHRITDRFPLHVVVWPVRVQGETTGAEVSKAISGFNAMAETERPDLLIVARGGGSIEDLWGFNDEAIVRAVAASTIPLISAVGHETDWTLIDLAADLRAPTPTGAAEIAVPVRSDLEATHASLGARLQKALMRKFENARSAFTAAERGLATPDSFLALPRRRFDEATTRLDRGLEMATRAKTISYERVAARLSPSGLIAAVSRNGDRVEAISRQAEALMRHRLEARVTKLEAAGQKHGRAFTSLVSERANRFTQLDKLLTSLSYQRVLDRGYALVRDEDGAILSSAKAAKKATALSIKLRDGEVTAYLGSKGSKSASSKPTPQTKKPPTNQGSLF